MKEKILVTGADGFIGSHLVEALIKKGYRVFIHFKCWNDSVNSLKVRELLSLGQDFKIMYVEPWFWKCINVY